MNDSHYSNEQLNSGDLICDEENLCSNNNGKTANVDNSLEEILNEKLKHQNHTQSNNNEYQSNINNNMSENTDLNTISSEYDQYINNLRKQLQVIKNQRKNSENQANIMKRRIGNLQNELKNANTQFMSIRKRIENILKNRAKAEEKLQKSIIKKNSYTGGSKIFNSSTHSHNGNSRKTRGHLSYQNITNVSNNSKGKNNYYSKDLKKNMKKNRDTPIFNNENNNYGNINNNDKLTISSNNKTSNSVHDKVLEEKQKLRNDLILKLKNDEIEKIRLQQEIAQIEIEELNLIKIFSVSTRSPNMNTENNNNILQIKAKKLDTNNPNNINSNMAVKNY